MVKSSVGLLLVRNHQEPSEKKVQKSPCVGLVDRREGRNLVGAFEFAPAPAFEFAPEAREWFGGQVRQWLDPGP